MSIAPHHKTVGGDLMSNRCYPLKQVARYLFVLVVLALSVSRASAQSAALSGVVTDASNAVVPGASVELLQPSTQSKQMTTANGSGYYSQTLFSEQYPHPTDSNQTTIHPTIPITVQ